MSADFARLSSMEAVGSSDSETSIHGIEARTGAKTIALVKVIGVVVGLAVLLGGSATALLGQGAARTRDFDGIIVKSRVVAPADYPEFQKRFSSLTTGESAQSIKVIDSAVRSAAPPVGLDAEVVALNTYYRESMSAADKLDFNQQATQMLRGLGYSVDGGLGSSVSEVADLADFQKRFSEATVGRSAAKIQSIDATARGAKESTDPELEALRHWYQNDADAAEKAQIDKDAAAMLQGLGVTSTASEPVAAVADLADYEKRFSAITVGKSAQDIAKIDTAVRGADEPAAGTDVEILALRTYYATAADKKQIDIDVEKMRQGLGLSTPSLSGTGCCAFGGACGDCGGDGNGWCHLSASNCAVCTGTLDSTAPAPSCGGSEPATASTGSAAAATGSEPATATTGSGVTATGCCAFGGACGDCGDDGNGWCHLSASNCVACTGTFDSAALVPSCGGTGAVATGTVPHWTMPVFSKNYFAVMKGKTLPQIQALDQKIRGAAALPAGTDGWIVNLHNYYREASTTDKVDFDQEVEKMLLRLSQS